MLCIATDADEYALAYEIVSYASDLFHVGMQHNWSVLILDRSVQSFA